MSIPIKQEIINYGNIEDYLYAQKHKVLLRFVICGSVDDGKSTLIGRLLHDSEQIYDDQLSRLYTDSKEIGTQGSKLDFALLVDGLQAERTQGITIDVAYRYFFTKKRKFIIADTPGHEEYTRNMVTGASTSDLAVLVVDVRKGIRSQTRRHCFISVLLGIKFIIVVVNKMDLVDYDKSKFQKIIDESLKFINQLSVTLNIKFIPISALDGDNISVPSINMSWYDGPTLFNILDSIDIDNTKDFVTQDLRFPIQYVIRNGLDFRGYAGTVASGNIYVGQNIKILSSNNISIIKDIILFNKNKKYAYSGEAITVTLKDDFDISRGDILTDANVVVNPVRSAWVHVIWMSKKCLKAGQCFNIKIATKILKVQVEIIQYQIDMDSLIHRYTKEIPMNGIGLIKLVFNELLILDKYCDYSVTGNMIFIDLLTNATVGAGMVHAPIINTTFNQKKYSEFELELYTLINRYFPHWNFNNLPKSND